MTITYETVELPVTETLECDLPLFLLNVAVENL